MSDSKLPCADVSVCFDNFCLENSPCRKCNLDPCPFDKMLDDLNKKLGFLYEFLDLDVDVKE